MKRYLLVTLVLGALLGFANPGWALFLSNGTDVGSLDPPVAQGQAAGNTAADELAWINQALNLTGTPGAFTSYTKYDYQPSLSMVFTDLGGNLADLQENVWAFDLMGTPEYFVIKMGTGQGTSSTPTHFLYENNMEFGWGVVDITALLENGTVNDIYAFSHWGETGGAPVPEPGTMLLLGSGLIGLAGFSRKKLFKK